MALYGYVAIPSKYYNDSVLHYMKEKAEEIYVNDIVEFLSYKGYISCDVEKFFKKERYRII